MLKLETELVISNFLLPRGFFMEDLSTECPTHIGERPSTFIWTLKAEGQSKFKVVLHENV